MIFQYSQDIFKIPERIQVISFCSFRDTIDDSTGICTIQTIDKLPCMLMETKPPQSTFCRIVVHRNIDVFQKGFQGGFLIDTIVDPIQSLSSGKLVFRLDFFCPCKEGLYKRSDIGLPVHLSDFCRLSFHLVVQMIDRCDPADCFIIHSFFCVFLCCFWQGLQRLCKPASCMGPAASKDDVRIFPVQLSVCRITVTDHDPFKIFQEFFRMV